MPRQASNAFKLAHFFVVHFLGREWSSHDVKGMHLKHASLMLKEYTFDDILGCLKAIQYGLIETEHPIVAMTTLRSGEPPIMARWEQFRDTPPPPYLTQVRSQWAELTSQPADPEQEELEPPPIRRVSDDPPNRRRYYWLGRSRKS